MNILGFTITKNKRCPIPLRGNCKLGRTTLKYVVEGKKFMAWKDGQDEAEFVMYDISIEDRGSAFLVSGFRSNRSKRNTYNIAHEQFSKVSN